MSAITGIFYRKGKKVDPQLIQKMNDKLSHRGPDGSHTWVEDNVGLGHQMLHTTPESLHERLPFIEEDLVITADARIDNREELAKKLDIADVETVSDSYFILKAYEKWGEDCPDKLLGDFAFAIWDRKKEILFCARDHMGVKPFYYYVDEEMFVFGTEIKALFEVGGVPRKLNEVSVAYYLLREISDIDDTFFYDIKNLKAAHQFLIGKNDCKMKNYWMLDPDLEIKMDSDEDYALAFREIFEEAIRCRLRSHKNIGFELSGGLDSSSIVCTAYNILKDEKENTDSLETFSSVYNETKECDERYYIKKVLNKCNTNYNFTNGDEISPLRDIENVLWHQDQPFFSPHLTNQIENYKKMNKKDIRILFSGEGGDQVVSHGNNYLKDLAFEFKWKRFFRELEGISKNRGESKAKIIKAVIIYPHIPNSMKKIIRLFLNKKRFNFELNDNFLKRLKLEKDNSNIDFLSSKEYHYFMINYPLIKTVFGILDRSTSPFNINIVYPFFDKRLVEFCYSLPSEMKLKSGWPRYVLRIAMENIMPPEIQWRSGKANLNVSFKRNLMLFEKNTIMKMINEDSNLIKDYINIKYLKNILEEYEKGVTTNLFDLWLAVLFYEWLKNLKINDAL